MTRVQRQEYHAKQSRLQKYHEYLHGEQARAQHHLKVLEQSMVDVDVAKTVVEDVRWRLKALRKLHSKIFGLMYPTIFSWRSYPLRRASGTVGRRLSGPA